MPKLVKLKIGAELLAVGIYNRSRGENVGRDRNDGKSPRQNHSAWDFLRHRLPSPTGLRAASCETNIQLGEVRRSGHDYYNFNSIWLPQVMVVSRTYDCSGSEVCNTNISALYLSFSYG